MPTYRVKLYRGSYYAVWSEQGQTKRAALSTADLAEAKRRLVDFERNQSTPAKGNTVGDYVRAYLDYKKGRVRDHVRLEGAWANAEPTFGYLRPDQVTQELCEKYAARRRNVGRSDGTILKEINVIRQAMNWSHVTEARFEAPSAPPPRDRWLTKEEANRLLAGAVQPHIKLYIHLALATGARRGAILDLTWDRVDFKRKEIDLIVPGETNRKKRAKSVPINSQLLPELQTAAEAAQTEYVIEYAGDRVLNIKKGFAAAVKRAGLVDVTPHDLRHTAAVWMAEDGVSFEEIAQYLGHSSPRITYQVYARFSPTYLRRAAKALEF
jgi:integrase